jgi:hypothetical protein
MTWEDRAFYFLAGFLGAMLPRLARYIVRSIREHERIVNEKHFRGIK